ncbi:MAG: hypothetical protein AAB336_10860, partial [Acidobacteriota bacterium]
DDRKRFCSHCNLNVYNLSEMTQREAENLLFEMEGKMCVRLYKRKDGTVITQDCPVGWQAIKQRVSRTATAVFGLIIGFFSGIFAVSAIVFDNSELLKEVIIEKTEATEIVAGGIENLEEIKPIKKDSPKDRIEFSGGISNGPELMDLMWIFTERYPKK